MQRILVFPPTGQARTGAAAWPRSKLWRWALPALLLIGLGLRLALIARPGLHPDEALYASWALRIADGSDPALLSVYVDKPPLWLYLLAGLFRLAGIRPGVATAPDFDNLVILGRLAGVAASASSLLLLHDIARRVYGRPVALLATALYAVSPLAIGLSPTLFSDPLLVLWLLLGLWAALGRRAWLTGMACGLAYATKQQAVLLIPLVVAVFVLSHHRSPITDHGSRIPYHASRITCHASRSLWRFLDGFLLVCVLVTWWDSLRWPWLPSFWDRSLATYGGIALAPLADLGPRLLVWGELLAQSAGSPLLAVALAVSLPAVGWSALRQWRRRSGAAETPAFAFASRFDLLLLAFIATYLLLHLLLNFAPWDRYALPLAPLLALLLARGLGRLAEADRLRLTRSQRRLLGLVLAISLFHAAWLGVSGRLPAGDARAYEGAAPLASYLRATQPAGAALYHHWLGWHYQFYLYDSPLEQRWWESPADLAAKAAGDVTDFPAQLIAFPAGRDETPVRQALAAAGLRLEPQWLHRRSDGSLSLSLYTIRPSRAGASHELP